MGFGERLGVMGLTKVKQGQVVRLCSIKSDSINHTERYQLRKQTETNQREQALYQVSSILDISR